MGQNMDTSDPLFSSSGLHTSSSGSSNDSFNSNIYNSSTPDLNASTGWTDRPFLSVTRENYETFQRQQKHSSWLQNRETLPCSRDKSETEENKQSPKLECQKLLLQTLLNAHKLIENLDIKGMLEKQTKSNDQLQKIIEQKNTVIRELKMKIQSVNISKIGPPSNTENKNQNKQDDVPWGRPKKSIKPTFPPT